MRLEDIGFYTLEDKRASQVSMHSPLWRCELILTDVCNFRCPYCRGLRSDCVGTMSHETARRVLKLWTDNKLKNIRFSGGEPTLYKRLPDLVKQAIDGGVKRVAISTNGSASSEYYNHMIDCGVNDFSISLDACCSSVGDIMAGIKGKWETVIENIRWISKLVYVTVGVVFTENTIDTARDVIEFAHELGVADIRIISSAQFNEKLHDIQIRKEILNAHPILNYRITHFKEGRNVRGITATDSHKCSLVLDDMAVAGKWHFPCIIFLRERGEPIGQIDSGTVREDRKHWMEKVNTYKHKICRENCLDVCIDYNNKVSEFYGAGNNIPQ